MSNQSNKKPEERGIAATAVDLAVGGAVLAADKAAEVIDDAIERGSEALEEAGETVRDAVNTVVGTASDAADDAVEHGRQAAASAKATIDDATSGRDTSPYESRSKEDLYDLAQERNIEGRSNMTKEELIEALRAH